MGLSLAVKWNMALRRERKGFTMALMKEQDSPYTLPPVTAPWIPTYTSGSPAQSPPRRSRLGLLEVTTGLRTFSPGLR